MSKILTSSELQKPNGKTGQPRIDILINEIKNDNYLTLIDNSLFKVTDKENAYKQIEEFVKNNYKGKIILTGTLSNTEDIIQIENNKLLKSPIFGGGCGMSLGTEQTGIIESAQCYYCAAVANVLNKECTNEDITVEILQNAEQYVNTTHTLSDVLTIDVSWVNSSITVANTLFSTQHINKDSRYYRKKNLMKQIYDTKRNITKKSNIEIQDDRWNPGDIWISNMNDNLEDHNNLLEFNRYIRDLLLSKKLLSVSLKKVSKEANIEYYNVNEFDDRLLSIENVYISGGKTYRSEFFNNKSVVFTCDGSECEMRSTNWLSSFTLSFRTNKNARSGSCGTNTVNYFLQENGINKISSVKNISSKIKNKDESFINDFCELYLKVTKDNINEEFISKLKNCYENKKNMDWIFSKYIGMEIIQRLTLENDGSKRALTDIINFAKSRSKLSSAFIKIS